MMIHFEIPGRPVPAARMTQRGKWVKRNASRYLAFKQHIGYVAREHCKEQIESAVRIKVIAYYFGGRPGDLDNIVKAVLDGLNKIAWVDDRQVVKIEAERRKGKPERTEVWVWPTEEELVEIAER